jgi:inosose dehydratase
VRLGFAPITWNNEDLASELGPPVPFETVLSEIAAAGYAGTELGDGFPRDPAALADGLAARGLTLTSAWCGLRLGDASPDFAFVESLCALLSAVGASYVNLAHQGAPERRAFAGRAAALGPLDASSWDLLAGQVHEAAKIAADHALVATFHAHVGTYVETRSEIEELLSRVPDLKLCWDVGHALYAGTDPVQFVRDHPDRIAYLHLKDVSATVLRDAIANAVGFEDAIRRRVFTELGQGLLDVPGLLAALRDVAYNGWLMVEQDSTWLKPAESAQASRNYLRSLGL